MEERQENPFLIVYFSSSVEKGSIRESLSRVDGVLQRSLEEWGEAPFPEEIPSVFLIRMGDPIPTEVPDKFLRFLYANSDGSEKTIPGDWILLFGPNAADDLLMHVVERWPSLATPVAFARMKRQFDDQSLVLDQLTEVSLALSSERDHNRLLDLILSRAILLAGCDAGSLYLKIQEQDNKRDLSPGRMRFAALQNNSVPFTFRESEIPITKESLAGYVALTGETLRIDNAYAIPDDAPYGFNVAFDKEAGYRTRSLLVLPMANHRGDITGVLQLINRKREPTTVLDTPEIADRETIPFDPATTELMRAVGSLAAVAIDNNRLYENIERLFEGFVKASVKAIEQRDPTTSGHSLRVSILTVELADMVGRTDTGPFAKYSFTDEQFRELRYAALLHDFGKVGVREQVLVKAKKLYPYELERVITRFEVAKLYKEREILLKKVKYLAEGGDPHSASFKDLTRELEKEESTLDRLLDVIYRANLPTVLPEGDFSALQEIADWSYTDRCGGCHNLLEPHEIKVLSIRKGSLNREERQEIEVRLAHAYAGEEDALLEEVEALMGTQSWPSD